MTRQVIGAGCAVEGSRSSRRAGVVGPRAPKQAVPTASSVPAALRRGVVALWALVLLAVLAVAVLVASGGHAAGGTRARVQELHSESLLSAPVALRSAVASTLGRKEPAYRIRSAGGALTAVSPAAQLRSSFTASGVSISAGRATLGLQLSGIGFGSHLQPVAGGIPHARENRVVYALPGLTQSYANGPEGVEQSFTLASAPKGASIRGPLTLAVALTGGLSPSLAGNGQAISLSRDGRALMRYGELSATDARGRLLHSWMSLQRGRLLLHVDAARAAYPLHVDPLVQSEVLALTRSSQLGTSVAISANGETALVGAFSGGRFSIAKGLEPSGAGYVFVRSGSTWVQQGELTEDEEGFAVGVALSADGNTATIGYGKDQQGPGAVLIYTRSGSTWSERAKFVAPSGNLSGDVAISADGSTVLAGETTSGSLEEGAVYVYTRSGEEWSEQAKLEGAGEIGAEPLFGSSLALSANGNTALIGGECESTTTKGSQCEGAAWVFTRSAGKWTQQGGKLTSSEQTGEAHLGDSVALSEEGNTALIGAFGDAASWVFTRSGETWTQQGKKLAAGGNVALSASGSTALIAHRCGFRFGGCTIEGEGALLFTRSGSTWSGGEALSESGLSGESGFGASVALSATGATALVGAPEAEEGAAVVFQAPPTVVTGSSSEVTPSSVTVGGSVSPAGEAFKECTFEYGTTSAYGSSAPCSPASGSGEALVPVSASLTKLSADTTYHFRVAATTGSGVHQGTDATFTTLISSATGATMASDEQLSASAGGGTGSVSVGDYGSDTGGPPLFESIEKYVDVYRSASATYTEIEVKDCEIGTAKKMFWYNLLRGWTLVSSQSYDAGSPSCIVARITEKTSPSLAQLTGTRFGFGESPGVQQYGKCVKSKDAVYSDAACGTVAEKKGVPDDKGKYEWFPAPVSCYAETHGRFADSGCTTLDEKKGKPKGKYEAGSGSFTGSGTSAKLEIKGAGALECEASTSTGEVSAPQTGRTTITLTGCRQEASKCTSSGQSTGTVKSEPLQLLTYEEDQKVFSGLVGNPVARFTCGSTSYTLTGGVSGETGGDVNAMSATSQVAFKSGIGEQQLKIVVGTQEHEASLSTSLTTTGAQASEIDTKVAG